MIADFFSVSNRSRLREVSSSWVGTPFHSHGAVKGRGVSCIFLIEEILIEVGAIERGEFKLPHGLISWGRHNEESLIEGFMIEPEVRKHLRRVDIEEGIAPGDIVPMRIERTIHHLGLAIDGTHLIHCHRKKGVMIDSFEDVRPFLTQSIYRLKKIS
tara:strand:+ start:1452 stop:1922 length:471 start_codon:yes stop_codon:yes gene_type:complete